MKQLKKALSWLDAHLLLIMAAFLFAFIPLFPKIPLFDILPGYIVRVRAEDFFVFLTGIVWLTQIVRKKVEWKTSVFFFVVAYALLGLTSMLLGSILTQTIPPQLIHIGKSALHFFRYLEYFSLFFFTYSAVKTKKDIKIFVLILALTVIAVAIYGAGQKYLNWPLYSTMNREYSKGEALYLSEFARVQSTFAGHYDLTAYLVLVLPILFAIAVWYQNWRVRFVLVLAQTAGIWLLLVGSSKGSLVAYLATIAIVLLFKLKTMHKSVTMILKWSGIGLVALVVLTIAMLTAAPELYRTLANTTKPISPVYGTLLKIDARLPNDSPLKLTQTNLTEEGNVKPDDVYVDVPDYVRVATTSATGEPTFILVEKERTWSENALKYGLSMGIRLDTLWPQALRGFLKNPITGSGYATLNKGESTVYTEADSTDNNFLRVLGETGLGGVIIFFGLLLFLFKTAYKNTSHSNKFLAALNVGYIAGMLGLLINALTIDVFAASKVAFTFWAISGFIYATNRVTSPTKANQIERSHLETFKKCVSEHSIMVTATLVFFFSIYVNPFTEKSPILNFVANPTGAEHIAIARCFLRSGTLELCRNGLIADVPITFYSVTLIPFLKLYNNPGMYFFANLAYLGVILTALYIGVKKITSRRNLQATVILLFVSYPVVLQFLARAQGTSVPLQVAVLLLLFAWTVENLLTYKPQLTKVANKTISVFFAVSVGLFVITFLNANTIQTTFKNFQNKHSHWRYMAVSQINNFFYDSTIGKNATITADQTPYLITATNPYYVDMFSNGMYTLMPLSQNQNYMEQPQNVWGEYDFSNLIDLYHQKLSTSPVFLSDVDVTENTQADFEAIHQNFDLELTRIGCDFNCFIYQLAEETEYQSPQPRAAISQLLLETVNNATRFSVVSTRFDEYTPGQQRTLTSLAEQYAHAGKNSDFIITTGDLLPKYDDSQLAALITLYQSNEDTAPILFTPGNLDLLPKKEPVTIASHFYTDQEFFLFIQPQPDGGIGESQQEYILNQLLDIDKMPNIKTIFVFTNQANWVGYDASLQDMSSLSVSRSPHLQDKFMITQVLPQLASLTDKQVFVVSGDIRTDAQTAQFEQHLTDTNLTFLSSSISTATEQRFITFIKVGSDWQYSFNDIVK